MVTANTVVGAAKGEIVPGTQLNGIYEIDALIATGGMGEVYRAHTIETHDKVAIKMIRWEYAADETFVALFKKEAAALNRIQHDAVIRYYVSTTDPVLRRPYLAMELIEGESLTQALRRAPLRYEDVMILMHRLASGLEAAHRLGIVHRDIAPDNIYLPDGDPMRAKIIDFGIARSAFGGDSVIGASFAGKLNFVSPEQVGLFDGEVSAKSDIYSLGLTLAAAAAGTALDMGGTHVSMVRKRQIIPDLSAVDAQLRPILSHMLEPNPRNRPASMGEIVAWSKGADGSQSGPRPVVPVRTKRFPFAALLAAIVLLVALAGGAGFFVFRGSSGPKDGPVVVSHSAGLTESDVKRSSPPATLAPEGRPDAATPARSDAPAVRSDENLAGAPAERKGIDGSQQGVAPPTNGAPVPPPPPGTTALPSNAENLAAAADHAPPAEPSPADEPTRQAPATMPAASPDVPDRAPVKPNGPEVAAPGSPSVAPAAAAPADVSDNPAPPTPPPAPNVNGPAPAAPAPAVVAPPSPPPSIASNAPSPAPSPPAVPSQAPAAAPQGAPDKVSAGGPGVWQDCPTCPAMVTIPAGIAKIGSNADATERPVHKVPVKAFGLSRAPVTVAEWRQCLDDKACRYDPGGNSDSFVHNLSFDDASDYTSWLSRITGHPYRLPTEVEWEYAAHGGTATRYWWGDDFRPDMAPCRTCDGSPAQNAPNSARFRPNPFGLYGVTGAVAQWTMDCWHGSYLRAPKDASAWVSPGCRERVLRGGSWMSDSKALRLTNREFYDATVRYPGNGFRVARDL